MRRTSTEHVRGTAPAQTLENYRLDDQLGFLLRRAYQRASANLAAAIAEHGLTVPQFAVLARLHECGGVSQNELGRLVVMEPANVRDVVQRLKRRALLATAPVDGDRRRLHIMLTASGAELVQALIPVELACTERTLASLGKSDRNRLIELLRTMLDG